MFPLNGVCGGFKVISATQVAGPFLEFIRFQEHIFFNTRIIRGITVLVKRDACTEPDVITN